jgi:hypothetical protein
MKLNYTKIYFYLTLFSIFFTSCTVEKRIHNKGYFVKWNTSNFQNTTKNLHTEHNVEDLSSENVNHQAENLSSSIETSISADQINNEQIERSSYLEKTNEAKISKTEKTTNEKLSFISKTKENVNQKNVNQKNIKQFVQIKKDKFKSFLNRADSDLIINIIVTVLLAAAIGIFIFLALAATGTIMYVWWGLALIAAIFFVTQLVDLIMW